MKDGIFREGETARSLEVILPELLRNARSAESDRLARHGVTLPQFYTMSILDNHDGFMMKELGEHLGLSLGTLTGIVDRLAKGGLVTRHADEADRRVIRVKLTRKGRGVLGDVNRDRARALAMATEGIPGKKLDAFFEVFETVMQRMNQGAGESGS